MSRRSASAQTEVEVLLNDRRARMSLRRAPCIECGRVLPRVGVRQAMPVTVEAVTHPAAQPST